MAEMERNVIGAYMQYTVNNNREYKSILKSIRTCIKVLEVATNTISNNRYGRS